MNVLTTIADLGQLASAIAAAAAIAIGVKTYRRQHNVDTFLHYTDRYNQIMARLPPWARTASADAPPHAPAEEVKMACLAYLNMCAEEYYLYHNRFLAKSVWCIWESEIVRTLRTPLFRDSWKALEPEFITYQKFRDFVNQTQNLRA